MKSGGTDYNAAFKSAIECVEVTKASHKQVLVFMTDGAHTGNNEEEVYEHIKTLKEMSKGMMLFCVGVGEEYNMDKLQRITREGNQGMLTQQLDDNTNINLLYGCQEMSQLAQAFQDIAYACSPKVTCKLKKIAMLNEQRDITLAQLQDLQSGHLKEMANLDTMVLDLSTKNLKNNKASLNGRK